MKLNFRRAEMNDCEEIARLEKNIFSDPWSVADIENIIGSEYAMCYTLECDGNIAAYLIGKKIVPEAEIYRIATSPAFLRKGMAKALLNFVFESENDIDDIYLEVRESNIPARNLYTGCGFKEIAIRKNYYKAPIESAINMHRGRGPDK